MILKWQDYSGATHLIDGIATATNYGTRHAAEAAAIAAHYDGDGTPVVRYIGPDVYGTSKAEAEDHGHSWKATVLSDPLHPEREGQIVETCGVSRRPFDGSEYSGEQAVLLDDDAESVTIVGHAERSYGVYVIVTWENSSRRRSHFLLDCQVAYLMNGNGITVDRLTGD